MQRLNGVLKTWVLPLGAVCAVVLATGYALAKRAQAQEAIRTLRKIGHDLNDAAQCTESGAMAPQQASRLRSQRIDLNKRMDESLKPGLVQAQLMATAHQAGLDVREVQHVGSSGGSGPADPASAYPHYRVLVRGRYSQIAEYLELCKQQRVPARSTEFRVTTVKDAQGADLNVLQAEITMEAFATPAKPRPSGKETTGA